MDVRLVELALPVSAEDAAFVAESLADLFAPIAGRADELRAFLDAHVNPPQLSLLIIEAEGARAGIVTLERFAMPRYLGHGYEIQELVIAVPFRRRGIARRALELVEERCRADKTARKVVIRTNVEHAQRAYAKVWEANDLTSYQAMLHLLQAD
jgi:ribosomal protein S18 acetylase RimI-like enzyme